MEQKLIELDQRVFALEQAAPKLTSSPGESKGFFNNLNPFGQGVSATSPSGESKGFLDNLNPFSKGGSRRKSRQSKKSNKSKKYRHSRR